MPNITQYTANSEPATLEITRRQFPAPDFAGEEFFGASVTEIGKNIGAIGNQMAHDAVVEADKHTRLLAKLQKEQDEIDTDRAIGQWRGGTKKVENDLNVEFTDPRVRYPEYIKRTQKLFDDIYKDLPNDRVKNNLRKEVFKTFPNQAEAYKIYNEKDWAAGQIVALKEELEVHGNIAARQLDIEGRDAEIAIGVKRIQESIHFPDAKTRAEAIVNFKQDTIKKQMKYLTNEKMYNDLYTMNANGAFKDLPLDDRTHLMRQALDNQYTDNTRDRQSAERLRDDATESAYGEANRGVLDIDALMRNTLIDESKKHAIIERNKNPVSTGGSIKDAIQSTYTEYTRVIPPTDRRIAHFTKRFNDLEDAAGPNMSVEDKKMIAEMRSKLKTDHNTLTSLGLRVEGGERGAAAGERAEIQAKINKELAKFNAAIETHKASDRFTPAYQNKLFNARNELKVRVGEGEKDVAEDLIKRFETKKTNDAKQPQNPVVDYGNMRPTR